MDTRSSTTATPSVLKFSTPDGAEKALNTLRRLQQQHLIQIVDAAVVEWPQEREAPRTRQAVDTTSAGALGGAFWGFLFGLIFFVPLLGMAVGAATGALGGALTDVGINDDFIGQARDKVTRGTSALFFAGRKRRGGPDCPRAEGAEPRSRVDKSSGRQRSATARAVRRGAAR